MILRNMVKIFLDVMKVLKLYIIGKCFGFQRHKLTCLEMKCYNTQNKFTNSSQTGQDTSYYTLFFQLLCTFENYFKVEVWGRGVGVKSMKENAFNRRRFLPTFIQRAYLHFLILAEILSVLMIYIKHYHWFMVPFSVGSSWVISFKGPFLQTYIST